MLRALEFYAGIGGLSLALSRCTVRDVELVAAFEWDPSAAAVYAYNNAKRHPVHRTDISRLSAAVLAAYNASVFLLSPPCQPYTVLSPDAKGDADPRASSFHHLMFSVLPDLAKQCSLPRFVFVENVAGFKDSVTHRQLHEMLASLNYSTREFLLSPLQFGIPNSRKRFYLLAKLGPLEFALPPSVFVEWTDPRDTNEPLSSESLARFLDQGTTETNECIVPDKVLLKWAHEFDIVLPSAQRTCCFTRGYTHLAQGSGSVLQENADLEARLTDEAVAILRPLRLRYFTPTELLRIFCFLPPSESQIPFSWPANISRKTKYKLLGNSVNVLVVRHLLDYLFTEPVQ
ncbi:S-adenosyl-L-methionine-dependent methyltransferase [Auricularia subglabra TFB-10046 SS5]|nr:S-adenosyl-L-methionine-dependent methyltransferase [Auricularia subglabra TFB-10046 SS5]